MVEQLKDIPFFQDWKTIQPIHLGWSKDKKYYIEDRQNHRLLLRTADINVLEEKKKEFAFIQKLNAYSFEMSQAIAMGTCNGGQTVYLLLSWVDGVSLESSLKKLPESEQYALGLQAGKILKEIHAIPVDVQDLPLTDRKQYKLEQLARYEKSNIRVENDSAAIDYVYQNIHRLNPLPPVYNHGDFHAGNLIYTPGGQVGVIDFNRFSCGDRYEDFYKIPIFDAETSIPFSIGEIDGYFDGRPTEEFWSVLAVYVAHAALFSIKWSEQFGADEVLAMQERCRRIFADYDNFRTVIPRWYTDSYARD